MDSEQTIDVKKTRFSKKTLICNLIVTLLCIASILSYFLIPLQKTTFTLSLNKTVLAEEFHDEFDDYFGDKKITIALPISITTAEMAKLALKPKQGLARLISDSVNNLLDTSYSDILNTLLLHMEHELKHDFIERINNKIIFSYDDAPLSEEELETIRLYVGVDDAYVKTTAQELIDAAFEESTSKAELTNLAREKFKIVYRNMANSDDPNLQDVTFTDSNEESVQNYIQIFYLDETSEESVLSQFSTERKAKETVEELIGDEDDIEGSLTAIFNGSGGFLISMIVSIIPALLLILMLLSVIFWLLLLFRTIKNVFTKKDEIKVKAVIACGIPLPLLIGVVPLAAASLLRKTIISNLFNGIIGVLSSASSSFSIKFGTCAWIPLILSIVITVFSFFAYGHKRKENEFNGFALEGYDEENDTDNNTVDAYMKEIEKNSAEASMDDDLSTDALLEEIFNDE